MYNLLWKMSSLSAINNHDHLRQLYSSSQFVLQSQIPLQNCLDVKHRPQSGVFGSLHCSDVTVVAGVTESKGKIVIMQVYF